MNKKQFFKLNIIFTLSITLILGILLLIQYINNSIPSHHFLAREDMPSVSNAWGILTIPVFTFFLLWLIYKRLFKTQDAIPLPMSVFRAFLGALIFGVVLGFSIQEGFKDFTSNMPLILFILALLLPTYRPEYFLGFVLGLTYFVGGVLPIIVGGIFLLISAIVHLLVRGSLLWLYNNYLRRKA